MATFYAAPPVEKASRVAARTRRLLAESGGVWGIASWRNPRTLSSILSSSHHREWTLLSSSSLVSCPSDSAWRTCSSVGNPHWPSFGGLQAQQAQRDRRNCLQSPRRIQAGLHLLRYPSKTFPCRLLTTWSEKCVLGHRAVILKFQDLCSQNAHIFHYFSVVRWNFD